MKRLFCLLGIHNKWLAGDWLYVPVEETPHGTVLEKKGPNICIRCGKHGYFREPFGYRQVRFEPAVK